MSTNGISSVTVFAPGSAVLVGPQYRIPARVVSVTLETNGHIKYDVTWWPEGDDEPTTYTFESWEVEEDEDSERMRVGYE